MGRYNRNSNYTTKKRFAKPANKPKTREARENYNNNNLSETDKAKLKG